jgi:hypothetical protein
MSLNFDCSQSCPVHKNCHYQNLYGLLLKRTSQTAPETLQTKNFTYGLRSRSIQAHQRGRLFANDASSRANEHSELTNSVHNFGAGKFGSLVSVVGQKLELHHDLESATRAAFLASNHRGVSEVAIITIATIISEEHSSIKATLSKSRDSTSSQFQQQRHHLPKGRVEKGGPVGFCLFQMEDRRRFSSTHGSLKACECQSPLQYYIFGSV